MLSDYSRRESGVIKNVGIHKKIEYGLIRKSESEIDFELVDIMQHCDEHENYGVITFEDDANEVKTFQV